MTAKTLIVYYSWSGTTAKMARLLQTVTGADLVGLTVNQATFSSDMYTTADIATEQIATSQLPPLNNALPDLQQYDTILIGGPVWSAKVATPVRTFLQQNPQLPAVVAPFYTDAGTVGGYETDFKQLVARSVRPGSGLTNSQLHDEDQASQQLRAWWQSL
ncbi:flavodoxin [Loigolactobacillus zhaoyuanensis]|uniref:Flavodoxin n=1 Tax=Loigolactobacillus zhaoyuanensis TaxID=2486017 RepID=A0ABW8UEV9_9LACO|nr:flavodoxin [Loigolactobacillus zhaoyuanensis]